MLTLIETVNVQLASERNFSPNRTVEEQKELRLLGVWKKLLQGYILCKH
jgi:hypothetical protein